MLSLALLLGACSGLPRFWHAEPSYHVLDGQTFETRVVDMMHGIYDVQVAPRDPSRSPAEIEEGLYVKAAKEAVQEHCTGTLSLLRVFRFGVQASPVVRLKCEEDAQSEGAPEAVFVTLAGPGGRTVPWPMKRWSVSERCTDWQTS